MEELSKARCLAFSLLEGGNTGRCGSCSVQGASEEKDDQFESACKNERKTRRIAEKHHDAVYPAIFHLFFGFIVVPYETRVLGPVLYGMVGAAMAAMIYFQNVIDFGFILSGTADVALHREDKKYLSHLFTAVVWGKVLLAAVCAVVLAVLCQLIAVWGIMPASIFSTLFPFSRLPDARLSVPRVGADGDYHGARSVHQGVFHSDDFCVSAR